MRRNAAAIVIIALVVVVMIYAGVKNSRPRVSAMIGNPQPLVYGQSNGKEAPDFVLKDHDNREYKIRKDVREHP